MKLVTDKFMRTFIEKPKLYISGYYFQSLSSIAGHSFVDVNGKIRVRFSWMEVSLNWLK